MNPHRSFFIVSSVGTGAMLVLLLSLALFAGAPAQAALPASTNVSGVITDTTWTAGGSPYIVTGAVTLTAGYTLTVAAAGFPPFVWVLSLPGGACTHDIPLGTSNALPPCPLLSSQVGREKTR